MPQPLKVLIVEDNAADAELTLRGLRRADYEPQWLIVETEAEYLMGLHSGIDVVLSDYRLPQFNALRALELLNESGLNLPFIIISGTIGEETAVEAMKNGAADYLLKDRLGRLGPAVTSALEAHRMQAERRRAENVLKESERRFREMLENIDLVAIMLDKDGRILFCNDNLLALCGFGRDEALGADWFSMFVPGDGSERRRAYLNMAKSDSFPTRMENPIKTKSGDLREIIWNLTSLKDSEGRFAGLACIGDDVTERRRAEQALRSSEERFRQIAENIQEVFWMANDRLDQILYVSPAYASIWGRSCESLYQSPRDWIEAVHPEDRERVRMASTLVATCGLYDEVYRIIRPDGATRWIRDRGFPIRNADGVLFRIVGTAEDITERKTLEEQFLRSQRLESVGMLAAGIAHDLNNVLSPVLMATPMLREHLSDVHDLEMLATVEKSAKRGAALIKQILGFAHGIAGQPVLMQLRHLLGDIATIINETFPKNILVETSIPNNLWTVTGNPTQIHQVLLNLCVNARDAMPHGGKLSLRAENRVLDASRLDGGGRTGNWLMLQVEDTGTGIDASVLPHIWEPFFTTKAADKGTGLGLSTVRGIVETHRGFITLETRPGEGTRFQVYLPAASGTPSDEPAGLSSPRGDGELILIVDDEANIREMVKAIVARHGYRVLAAVDGIDAISMLAPRAGEIDLIITDMAMPRLGGKALIDVARRMVPAVKVLAISGGNLDSSVTEGPGHHADAFLVKPFTSEALLNQIHELLHVLGDSRRGPAPIQDLSRPAGTA